MTSKLTNIEQARPLINAFQQHPFGGAELPTRYARGSMKPLFFLLLISFLSGCVNLSKESHMMISEDKADYSDSFCGYASAEWAKIGGENKAEFRHGDLSVSFCANAFYTKNIAAGFIVPFIPINGREYNSKRWVQITNSSEQFSLDIETSLQFCQSRYPDVNCKNEQDFGAGIVSLKKGESGWISLPDEEEYDLKLITNETEYVFTFTRKKAYSWWMITV